MDEKLFIDFCCYVEVNYECFYLKIGVMDRKWFVYFLRIFCMFRRKGKENISGYDGNGRGNLRLEKVVSRIVFIVFFMWLFFEELFFILVFI